MKHILTLALACTLAACATEVPAYRWHRTGASESDVSRQINRQVTNAISRSVMGIIKNMFKK